MHLDIHLKAFEIISILLGVAVLVTPYILYSRKAKQKIREEEKKERKGEQEKTEKTRLKLITGQATIIEKLSATERDLNDLFTHKENSLKQPAECAQIFVAKDDLRNWKR
ncbi:hypothetical protein KAR91_69480 [Candidatus Pacearchaeota archaeon]|nr:hypothetical protein [Candidatus Pacearchaeota archaeon]